MKTVVVVILSALALLPACGAGSETPLSPGSDDDGGTPPPTEEAFKLLFRDDFDALDSSRWDLMTHSWDTNLALFSSESAQVEDGILNLTLLASPEGTTDSTGAEKPYLGAEVRSKATLTYGRVRARVRFAKGPAVVSSLVTIYTPWPADNWNELDIECLGKGPDELQFNTMVYTGPEKVPPVTTSVSPTQFPAKLPVGFDTSADFHEYTMEWTPTGAFFYVDDVLMHSWNQHIDLMNLPQNVLLTIWASNSASWAGAVGEDTVGAVASYDWVELWSYVED